MALFTAFALPVPAESRGSVVTVSPLKRSSAPSNALATLRASSAPSTVGDGRGNVSIGQFTPAASTWVFPSWSGGHGWSFSGAAYSQNCGVGDAKLHLTCFGTTSSV